MCHSLQEKIRSAQLEESIQQTDRLLFHLIPKPIADKLRNGETPLNTCREFSCVSILFSDIVSFTPMCSRIHPMEVVCVLNAMYVAFDKLCEIHHVYKVSCLSGPTYGPSDPAWSNLWSKLPCLVQPMAQVTQPGPIYGPSDPAWSNLWPK